MRVENWDLLLAEYLEQQANTPFVWGFNDCCHFAAKAAEIITGTGYGYLYPCESALSAQAMLEQHGGVMAISDKHYKRLDNINFAQRGDAACAELDGIQVLGVCVGSHAAFKSADGLVYLPVSAVLVAWRVG